MPYDEGVATRELGAILQDHDMIEAATKQLQKLDAWADADEATELLTLVQPRDRRGSGSALKQIGAMVGGIASRVSTGSSRKNSRTGSVIGGTAAPTAADGSPPRAPTPQPNGREAPEGEASPNQKAKATRAMSPLVGDSHEYLTA